MLDILDCRAVTNRKRQCQCLFWLALTAPSRHRRSTEIELVWTFQTVLIPLAVCCENLNKQNYIFFQAVKFQAGPKIIQGNSLTTYTLQANLCISDGYHSVCLQTSNTRHFIPSPRLLRFFLPQI